MRKIKNRFLEIYNTFSPSEEKEFWEFTAIPFVGKGRNYNKFHKNLKADEKGIKSFRMNESKKNKTYSNRISELTILAEKFLMMKNLDKNKFAAGTLLLDELAARKIFNYYKQRNMALKKITLQKKFSLTGINELYEIHRLLLKNTAEVPNSRNIINIHNQNFDYRLVQFIIEILDHRISEYYLQNYNPAYIQGHRTEIFRKLDLEYILSYFKKNLPEYYPLISFYYYIYKSFVNSDDKKYYLAAKRILIKDLTDMSKEDKSVLYKHLIEYNINRINNDELSAKKEMFFLLNKRIKEGMIGEEIGSLLQNFRFVDYIMIALSLNKLKWAENFIGRFGELLHEKYKDDTIFLCKAFLEYYRNNFPACKEFAGKVKKINPFFYIHASKLSMQSIFELNNFDECHIILKRLREYIRILKNTNKQLLEYTAEFCSSFALLLRLKDNPGKKNYLSLEFNLSKGSIAGRKWIKRKMEEIKEYSGITV